VGNFCPVQIVPDKRYSPFAKQKVVPRGLDSMRACRSVSGRTCTPRQVGDLDASARSGAVSRPGIRRRTEHRNATRGFRSDVVDGHVTAD
jgi:hypothetical protein